TIWFSGLPASGKSTLARELEKKLFNLGYATYILDGDNVRLGINKDLGFSLKDREENIRRVAEIAKLFNQAGVIVLCSFVAPTEKIRQMACSIIGKDKFLEVYVNTPLEVCEKRDPKGLYKKAREGKIKDFTGISSPFEEPENPFLSIDTSKVSLSDAVARLVKEVVSKIGSITPQ
ncbi:MAG: adenylyl-sulfate kinase, partial [Candidatus Dadabacteria bacterium]